MLALDPVFQLPQLILTLLLPPEQIFILLLQFPNVLVCTFHCRRFAAVALHRSILLALFALLALRSFWRLIAVAVLGSLIGSGFGQKRLHFFQGFVDAVTAALFCDFVGSSLGCESGGE